MKAIDNVLNYLEQHNSSRMNTEEIANGLHLSRSVVSGYLAKLYKQDKVSKSKTRPVVWSVKEKKTPFSKIIGHQGSLKESIELAKESILYPSHGLPVMITGRSGVGKSYLAKKIYEEAKALGVIDKDAPFVTLNTADYANNNELLSSVLFGYKKGAFTGADHDELGLIDKANNGYLFLDEVHRLSKANQEKLFSLIDNDTFYPLGEVNKPHIAHIRLICATTEDLNKYMLKTFMRRIPVHIELPQLIDRPTSERIEYVLNCFKNESVNTKVTYLVREDTILNLANKNFVGNLGTLQNKVKMLCSKNYALDPSKNSVEIKDKDCNSQLIKINKLLDIQKVHILKKTVQNNFEKIQVELVKAIEKNKNISDLKLIINKNLRLLKPFVEAVNSAFIREINDALEKNIKEVIKNVYGIDLQLSEEDKSNLIFGFRLSTFLNIKIQNNKEYFELLRNKYSRAFYVYRKFLSEAKKDIKDESYLWFFLLMANVIEKIDSITYTSILLAHGTSTAKSIQMVVNNLANNYIFEAFDMSIEASVTDINNKVYHYLVEQKAQESGIILLFDMGSLNQMFTKIKHTSNKELLVINNITTATALDVAMRVQRKEDFNSIASKAEKYGKYLGVQYFEGLSNKKNIIVSCLSGLGLSKAIKNIMESSLSTKHQIFTMDYRKLHNYLDNHNESYFKNTDLIITTTNFKTTLDLPIINIYDILDKNGSYKLHMYLQDMGEQDKKIDDVLEKFLKFLTIEGVKNRLEFLNPTIVIEEVQTIVKKYEDYYNIQFSGKIKLNLYMHLSLMIERVLLNSDRDHMQNLFKDEKSKEFESVSKTIFKPIEMRYNINVNDFEISLIYELIESYI